jgi:hypothetical protein
MGGSDSSEHNIECSGSLNMEEFVDELMVFRWTLVHEVSHVPVLLSFFV